MVDIQTVSIMLASASVIVGVVYYALQLRHQNRMRQTDLVIRLSSALDNIEFSKVLVKIATSESEDLDKFVEECSPEGLLMVANYFERVGVLVRRKLADADLVSDILVVAGAWERLKPWVFYVRQTYDPNTFEGFEYLYNEMKKRERQASKTA